MRRQLPVHSPVTWTGIRRGALAVLRGAAAQEVRARLMERLKSRYIARDVLLTDSGTTALRLAIECALQGTQGCVALPGYGCFDLATAAVGANAPVALYDVDPTTLAPDLESLHALRPARPTALVVAHWFGHLADVPAAGSVHPDAVLIEDAAQGVGGSLRGRPLGSFGSLAVLSFGRGKGTTGGGGGALLAHDERGVAMLALARTRLAEGERGLRQMVALAAQLILGRPSLYSIPASLPFLHLGETVYHPPRAPRAEAASAAEVLDAVWTESDREVEIRKRNAGRLLRAVARSPRLTAMKLPDGAEPGFLRLPALASGAGRAALLDGCGRSQGLAAGYPRPLDALPALAGYLVKPPPPLPGAARLAADLVTLPTHRLLAERDLRALESWIAGP